MSARVSLMTATTATTLILGVACAHSPTGRPQLLLVSDDEMAKMGAAAFSEVKRETPLTQDASVSAYVQCVAGAITQRVAPNQHWEVAVFEDEQANAFALPGGKIGVHTGLLRVAESPDQLATVLGHEVAHVIARHGNARVSAALATNTGLSVGSLLAGGAGAQSGTAQLIGLLGVGAQLGVLLPYSRAQETEADVLGLDYMAQAGFDPAASLELWRNMANTGGAQPPTFLSTHPSHEGRIEELASKLPEATARFQAARHAGNTPHCPRSDVRPARAPVAPPEGPRT